MGLEIFETVLGGALSGKQAIDQGDAASEAKTQLLAFQQQDEKQKQKLATEELNQAAAPQAETNLQAEEKKQADLKLRASGPSGTNYTTPEGLQVVRSGPAARLF